MDHRGFTLHELQRNLPGPVSVRITASTRPVRQWMRARWRCGCCAEGAGISDLLLLERCNRHALTLVPSAAAR